MPTLRDIFDWFAIQKQNEQHHMLAQNLMDNMRQATALRMGSPSYPEQAPYGFAHNYTDSLPFTLNDRMFYQSPGLWDQMNNQQPQVSLENMFKPSPRYT